jgi:hypothetical protein
MKSPKRIYFIIDIGEQDEQISQAALTDRGQKYKDI